MINDPLGLLDRNMQDSSTAYDTFVTNAAELERVTSEWYQQYRAEKGEPGLPALSDLHHGYWRGISREVYALGFRTLRQAYMDAWPISDGNGGTSPSPFPPEFGRINRNGQYFFREDGGVFDWRGVTAFMAFARHRRGENLEPLAQWWKSVGFNVIRVFVAGVDWDPAWYGDFNDFKRPFDEPQYQQQLDRFYQWAAGHGIRVESTVCTYAIDSPTWARAAQLVYDVAQHHWNATFVETVNEPSVGHGDPLSIMATVNRRGVLSAYGIQPGFEGDTWLPCPVLDYCTPHLPRNMPHFAHNGKDLMGISDTLHVPSVDDEPIGVWEHEKPAPGQRTNNRDNVVSHFATSRLFGGATFHYHEGLPAQLPGPTADMIARAVSEVWRFIPPEAVLGAYAAPHLSGFPLQWVHNQSSRVNHAYATINGLWAWAINCLPASGWHPIGINGWTVVSATPDGLVSLRR